MRNILLVEDSHTVQKVLQHLIEQQLPDDTPISCFSLAQTKAQLIASADIWMAVVDLNLPDAPNGEALDYLKSQGIPCIVLTGTFSVQKRKQLIETGIVDYIVKESRSAYQYTVNLLKRLSTNHQHKLLIVDDSKTVRHYLRQLLARHLYQVLEAADGAQALDCIEQNPEIKLVITDYEMPNMDGFMLVNEIRKRYDKKELAIIGLSSVESQTLSAQFIKQGANDFLPKNFYPEELYCRINQNIEMLELIRRSEYAANHDGLTDLYNRRAFFEQAQSAYQQAKQQSSPLSLALIDLDKFKTINDTFGHACGDLVLIAFAKLFKKALPEYLLARVGGEEFCVCLPGLPHQAALSLLDSLRQSFSQLNISYRRNQIPVTMSAGVVSLNDETSLDELIRIADTRLYQAKHSGRNRVSGET